MGKDRSMRSAGTSYRFDLRIGSQRMYVGIYNAARLRLLLTALRPGTALVLCRDGHGVTMEFASPASALQWIDRQGEPMLQQGQAA